MTTTIHDSDQLREAVRQSYDELAEDARRYLTLLDQLRKHEGSEDDLDRQVALETQVGVMPAHAASLDELPEAPNDALAEGA